MSSPTSTPESADRPHASTSFWRDVALKVAIACLSESRERVIEGMIGIAQGENPRSIEAKLRGYLHFRKISRQDRQERQVKKYEFREEFLTF